MSDNVIFMDRPRTGESAIDPEQQLAVRDIQALYQVIKDLRSDWHSTMAARDVLIASLPDLIAYALELTSLVHKVAGESSKRIGNAAS